MTDHPTPGSPIAADDVGLLKRGDVLLCIDPGSTLLREFGPICWFEDWQKITLDGDEGFSDTMITVRPLKETLFNPSRFTFIGRPDADGWIAAPEGGWKENPVPGAKVDYDTPWGGGVNGLADKLRWPGIKRFRLSLPTDRRAEADTPPSAGPDAGLETVAWAYLDRLYPNDAPSDLAYDANEMVGAFLEGAGHATAGVRAHLERIAENTQHRSGCCQTDISVEPKLSAVEMQTEAIAALDLLVTRHMLNDAKKHRAVIGRLSAIPTPGRG